MGARNGRLHFQAKSGQYGAWAVKKNDPFQYFQVDFGNYAKVTGVATQGRQDGSWWVKTYSLSFSNDCVFFEDYKEADAKKVRPRQSYKWESHLSFSIEDIKKFAEKHLSEETALIDLWVLWRNYHLYLQSVKKIMDGPQAVKIGEM